jgi:chromosome segregation and condensation protein ScpB
MARGDVDPELSDLPPELRWREWMGRVEAIVFAAPEPVRSEMLARVVGRDCPLDLLIDDIRAELKGRPYDLVKGPEGYAFRTRARHGAVLRAAFAIEPAARALSALEAGVLAAIAYEQPITRAAVSERFGERLAATSSPRCATRRSSHPARARRSRARPSPM